MSKRKRKSQNTKIIFVIIILAITFAAILSYFTDTMQVCDTQECFIERAEKCSPTLFYSQEDDQIVMSRIFSDCSVLIQAESIDEFGKREILSKKTCFYEKNKFAETILESDVVTCKTE